VLNTSLKSACLLWELRSACCWWPWHRRSNPVKFRSLAMMVFSCFLFASTVVGQDTGAIKGTVEDTAHGIVAGAQVKLRNQTTGQEVLANSDEQGKFQFEQLPLGEYLLIVIAEGFESSELRINLEEQRDSLVHVQLRIATTTQSVVVSANASTPIAGQNVDAVELDRHLLEHLPTKEGDPLAVPSLFLDPATGGVLGPKIIVDGVESSALEVPLTSIRKVYVNKSPYSAEFGRPGRGRVEVLTRKGSPGDYHGTLTLLTRNSALDARNAFASQNPPLQREIAEAELDGPLGRKARFLAASRYYVSDDSAIVHADTLTGSLIENIGVSERNLRVFGRLDFDLSPKHTLTVSYKYKKKSQQNQGVGGFNLPERATDFTIHENEVKVFERAIVSPSFINYLRFAYKEEPQQTTSRSDQPGIIVLGAFSSGGAQIAQYQRETAETVQDIASIVWGRQTLMFGGGARPRFFHTIDSSNSGGTFTFANLAAYAAGQPELFTMNRGNAQVSFAQNEYFSFIQDEIQVRPSLSVSVGLRYEEQSNLDHHRNFAPRLAFAYAPHRSQTVLRGGFGIFYDRQPEIMKQQALLYDGSQGFQIVVRNPGYPVPYDPALPPPPSLLRIAPGIRAPYLTQASLAVERKLGKGANFVSIDYTLVRGIELYRTRNINAPLPGTGAPPDPNFINIDQFESSGRSRSHSVTLSVHTTVGKRIDLLGQYTFSKALDDTSGMFSLPDNNYDLRSEFGTADYDRRHRVNVIGTYRLPGGFRAGSIVSINSSMPYNITTGFDNNGDTVPNDRPAGVNRNTGKGPGYASVDLHLAKQIMLRSREASAARPAAQEQPSPLSALSAARNTGGLRLEVGIDAFNVLNEVNYKDYVGIQSSRYFGRPNAANPARQLQLSLRLHF
jgi:carboxypeptidase family protein